MLIDYETNCTCVSPGQWNKLMENRKRFSFRRLAGLIKKQYPEFYNALSLKMYKPYPYFTWKTPTHLILTHSAIEYFFRYEE